MMNDFNYENEIIELDSDKQNNEEEIETLDVEEEKPKKRKNKNKRSLKDRWDDLDKKKKILIISSLVIMFLLIIGLVVYLVFFKKENNDLDNKEPIDNVVIEKDNYRYDKGNLVFLDKNDREIGTYECENKDSQKCFVAKLDYSKDKFERVLNVNNKDLEIEKNSSIYYDKFVFINDGNDVFFYDMDTKEKDLELKSIKSYGTTRNFVVIEDKDSKYGLIEITDQGYETLIKPTYENLGIINPELAILVVEEENNNYLVDTTGKKLTKDFTETIMSANESHVVGLYKNNYNLYDYDNKELIGDYDYIGLHDEVISLVKTGKVYLKDDKLNDLYIDGIKLSNKDYVKKYVYDEDNKLVETKVSYEVKVNGNNVLLTVDDVTTNINMLEAKLSAKLNYMSYLDGKLYFYSDLNKEELIGTYTCTNKNSIDKGDSTLSSCNIFVNEQGTSGIYNNEYVFIYDTSLQNTDKPTYYLYDLKTKKSRGTYSSLEFVSSEELTNEIKPIFTSASYIIAKSGAGANMGNYGILEINSEKAVSKVEFKYSDIKHNGDYYLLANIDKVYSVYDKKFQKISNEFDYIEIFDDYYVGINNNKLNVYAYDDALGILHSDLPVSDNKFTIKFNNGFDITINNVVYSYDLDGYPKDGE